MAKEGIDFFPLNCQLDEKIELIEAQYGLKGFAVVVKLFQRIYGEHGPQSRTEESENAVWAIGQAGYDITQTADWLERFYEAVWPTEKGEKQAL